jgi:hypothetical protein
MRSVASHLCQFIASSGLPGLTRANDRLDQARVIVLDVPDPRANGPGDHFLRRIGREQGFQSSWREVRGGPLRRDRKDELDFADIGGEADPATHAGEDNAAGAQAQAIGIGTRCNPRRERLENISEKPEHD